MCSKNKSIRFIHCITCHYRIFFFLWFYEKKIHSSFDESHRAEVTIVKRSMWEIIINFWLYSHTYSVNFAYFVLAYLSVVNFQSWRTWLFMKKTLLLSWWLLATKKYVISPWKKITIERKKNKKNPKKTLETSNVDFHAKLLCLYSRIAISCFDWNFFWDLVVFLCARRLLP